ncbi:MAG: hypothetical protein SF053_11045 [Bacteroidia bacterium]|nr:hypothetical protein [Bacteroidia bacterium]
MKKIITLSLAAFLMLAGGTVRAGGPWASGKNHGYAKLGQRAIVGRNFFNLSGEIIPITTTGVYITSFYGEYGLTNRLTARAYLPFYFRSTLNEVRYEPSGRVVPGDVLNSVSDVDVSLSYALIQGKPFALGASLQLGLPVGNPGGGATGLLQSGDGEFNQLLRLEAGYSFHPAPVFVHGSAGFNNRTRGFSDDLHFTLEGGITLRERVTLILKSYAVIPLRNGDANLSTTGLFSNNIQYISFGPEVNVRLAGEWGISAAIFGAGAGRNVLAAPSLESGVYVKF